jgi:hypothetical protein
MPFTDLPGYQYTDPMDFHDGTIYHIEADLSNTNHTVDQDASDGSFFVESSHGGGLYAEPFPDWSAAAGGAAGAWACCNQWAILGRHVGGTGVVWSGTCPLVSDPSSFGALRGTGYTGGFSEDPGPDLATASTGIGGFELRPWELYSGYTNQWLGDPTLESELIASVDPPDGWFVQWEAFVPIFLGFDLAPDEDTTVTQPYDEVVTVTWLYDPPPPGDGGSRVWAYYGRESGGDTVWGSGLGPDGTELCTYAGGLHTWVTPPTEWQPTQDLTDPGVCAFVIPEDENTAAIPLTTIGFEVANNVSSGRAAQGMVLRAAWRTPRFRYYRAMTEVPPRRGWGRPRGRGFGDNTVQGSLRGYGGIL